VGHAGLIVNGDASSLGGAEVIELSPGRGWVLSGGDGEPLTRLWMGLGWDPLPDEVDPAAPQVDLDATAVQFSGGRPVDIAFYNNPVTRDGAVRLLGDNRTGRDSGDDESIEIDLERTDPQVDTILFMVSSYQGHILEWVRNAYCRLVDEDGVELARLTITGGGPYTGVVLAKVVRADNRWRLDPIGAGVSITIPIESVDELARFL
jgi:tellurium resistance protein TerZ